MRVKKNNKVRKHVELLWRYKHPISVPAMVQSTWKIVGRFVVDSRRTQTDHKNNYDSRGSVMSIYVYNRFCCNACLTG